MPRVTKAMLERDIEFLRGLISDKDHKIELLTKEVALLHSPVTTTGQLTVMVIALEKIAEATAHVLGDLKRKP